MHARLYERLPSIARKVCQGYPRSLTSHVTALAQARCQHGTCARPRGALTARRICVLLRPGRHLVVAAPVAAACAEPHGACDAGRQPDVHREAAGCCDLEGCAGHADGQQHPVQAVPQQQCGPCARPQRP